MKIPMLNTSTGRAPAKRCTSGSCVVAAWRRRKALGRLAGVQEMHCSIRGPSSRRKRRRTQGVPGE